MTDITFGGSSPGRLKIKLSWVKPRPDPAGRASWEVFGRRFLVVNIHLGYVNADGREDAMRRAREKWPDERHITISPA